MVRENWVKSQVASYQRLKKWYLIPPCLTLSNIRYVSRVKWSNPGKRVAPSSPLYCSSYWKGSFTVALDYGCQLYLLLYLNNWRNLIVLRSNVKQFYLTNRSDSLVKMDQGDTLRSEWTKKQWQYWGTPHSLKLQDWSLTIRSFSVISSKLVGRGSHLFAVMQSVFSTAPTDWSTLARCGNTWSYLPNPSALFCLYSWTLKSPFICLQFMKWIFSFYFSSFLLAYDYLCFFL